ncbi:ABC transporter permease [Propionicicella superfundia]|uniref:ABC transporter permease n=1 Tax=Propionicicella superfundia TaxID=348582 RepID=UPI000414977A|nr:ABC transporter permease [Propionicicella superfundia]
MSAALTLPRVGATRLSLGGLVRGELIKLGAARSSWWAAGTTVAMMVAMAVTMALSAAPGSPLDATAVAGVATGGVTGAQFAAIALGVLTITTEFRTGRIQSTFAADPGRTRVLAAKAIVVAGASFLTTLAASLACFVLAHVLLAIIGHGATTLFAPGVVRILFGAAAYMAFVALTALAAGTVLRRTAGAVTVVLLVLWAVPGTAVLLPGTWAADVVAFLPASAGASLYSSGFDAGEFDILAAMTPAGGLHLAPWQGLLVVLVYLAGFAAAAVARVRRIDV